LFCPGYKAGFELVDAVFGGEGGRGAVGVEVFGEGEGVGAVLGWVLLICVCVCACCGLAVRRIRFVAFSSSRSLLAVKN